MNASKLSPEAKKFMQQMKTTKKTGTSWRQSFREFLIAHPVTTVDEVIKATRPDLVQALAKDRKKILKNVSSQLTYLRKELMDVEMNDGVITLHQYFDFTANKAVKPKTTTTKRRKSASK